LSIRLVAICEILMGGERTVMVHSARRMGIV